MRIAERILHPQVQMHLEALGAAPGQDRLQGRKVLVVSAGQRVGEEADPGVLSAGAIGPVASG